MTLPKKVGKVKSILRTGVVLRMSLVVSEQSDGRGTVLPEGVAFDALYRGD